MNAASRNDEAHPSERPDPALESQIESVRAYLTWVAHRSLDPTVTAKVGVSDVVQETLLEAHRRAPTYRGNGLAQLRSWLESILRHRISREHRRHLRTAKRDARREVALHDPTAAGDRSDPIDPPAPIDTPSQQFMHKELLVALVAAIDRLPPRYRQVVRLYYQAGRSYDQIATELQVSPEAVRKLWARALDRLRQDLRADHASG